MNYLDLRNTTKTATSTASPLTPTGEQVIEAPNILIINESGQDVFIGDADAQLIRIKDDGAFSLSDIEKGGSDGFFTSDQIYVKSTSGDADVTVVYVQPRHINLA